MTSLPLPTPLPRSSSLASLPLSLRLALRDLRGGLSGFYILILCIALGSGVIGTVNSISAALQNVIVRDGKKLLGGDIEAALLHRQATPDERAYLGRLGQVSEVATLRSMARKPDGSDQALVDLKAVDEAYPLFGELTLEDGSSLNDLRGREGLGVDRTLLEQLNIKVGDSVSIGRASFPIVGVIAQEPDKLAAGPAFGARVILTSEALAKTGLIEPGSLVRWAYRLKTANPAPSIKYDLAQRFPEAGFLVRDSSDPSPGLTVSIKRLNDFLTLVALTAMLTGGIGVANAVSTFVERRRKTIATFKAVGASGRQIFNAFFIEVAILALIGIVLGLFIAAAAPIILVDLAGDLFPTDIYPGPYAAPLAFAALFGVLTALPFILWPLGRAQEVRVAELFRTSLRNEDGYPPLIYRVAAVVALFALGGATVVFSEEKRLAGWTCAGLIGVFALFWIVGIAIRRGAALLPRTKRPALALSLLNIAGPASLSKTIALSLGTGLTVLTAVSLIEQSITNDLKSRLPQNAPSLFFIGIKKSDVGPFKDLIQRDMPNAKLTTAPMLRGRIVSLKGVPVEQYKAPASAEWVLNGDRGITISETLPSGSEVLEGTWWPSAYEGEGLVSFEADTGRSLGLHVGDAVTVNVLGRNITAKIANFRKVQWASIEINFIMIFSPNTLRQAPFSYLATLSEPEKGAVPASKETALIKTLGGALPEVSVIRVRDALAAVNSVFEKIMRAISLAGGVTLIMGGLVVAGALVSAQRRRVYEAVILRTLGATKRQIVVAHVFEYAILSVCLCVVAAILGSLLAYVIVTQVMGLSFNMSTAALLQPSILETIFVVGAGTVGTLRVLSVKPAYYLRSE